MNLKYCNKIFIISSCLILTLMSLSILKTKNNRTEVKSISHEKITFIKNDYQLVQLNYNNLKEKYYKQNSKIGVSEELDTKKEIKSLSEKLLQIEARKQSNLEDNSIESSKDNKILKEKNLVKKPKSLSEKLLEVEASKKESLNDSLDELNRVEKFKFIYEELLKIEENK
ncbi:hypothetical protein [Cetobacterium sp.]|uniref:hypothetical protein n=1 Tax=Cetobacterium sp. TaxID=2071632 RepID=UPI003F2CDF4D